LWVLTGLLVQPGLRCPLSVPPYRPRLLYRYTPLYSSANLCTTTLATALTTALYHSSHHSPHHSSVHSFKSVRLVSFAGLSMSKQPLFPGAAPPAPAAKRPRVSATSSPAPAIATSSPTPGAGAELECTESSAAIDELAAKSAALDAKEKADSDRKRVKSLRQKQRRALGLRYDWVLGAVKWLVCCFPETGVPITVHEARATVFDYDSWLDSDDLPANFLHKELGTFAKHYSVQFEREFGEGWFSDLLSEWRVVVKV
jgi:hypothetical protein